MIRIRFFGSGELKQNRFSAAQSASVRSENRNILSSTTVCRNCGQTGLWAASYPKRGGKEDDDKGQGKKQIQTKAKIIMAKLKAKVTWPCI